METIILDLRSVYGLIFRKWLVAAIFVFILIGIVLILTSVIPANYFIVIAMVILLIQAIGNLYGMKPVKLIFDEKGVSGSINPRKAVSLTWDQIHRIEIRLFAIDIQIKDGRTEHIDLSGMNNKQQKTVKSQIIGLARVKGIEVAAV